jgi:hypothetical protein
MTIGSVLDRGPVAAEAPPRISFRNVGLRYYYSCILYLFARCEMAAAA